MAVKNVSILEVILTITKLFQNVKETQNRAKSYLWTLRKNDSSTPKNILENTNERELCGCQYLPIIYL